MQDSAKTFDLEIKRSFSATPAELYAAWTAQEQFMQWCFPKNFSAPVAEMNVVRGGSWRLEMHSDKGEVHTAGGIYRELDLLAHALSFSHGWEDASGLLDAKTHVSLRIKAKGDQSELTFSQTGFGTEAERDSHESGWGQAFDNLDTFLAKAN